MSRTRFRQCDVERALRAAKRVGGLCPVVDLATGQIRFLPHDADAPTAGLDAARPLTPTAEERADAEIEAYFNGREA